MFEDYFFTYTEIYKEVSPYIYIMLNFLDYSYYEEFRMYPFNLDNVLSSDRMVSVINDDRTNYYITYRNFIDTFEVLFNV